MEYSADYERIDWENYSSTRTPLNASNLNKMDAAIKKHDDAILELSKGGGGGGTSDYAKLANKPSINGHTLVGDLSSEDLGIIEVTKEEKANWNSKASQSSVDALASLVGQANAMLEEV